MSKTEQSLQSFIDIDTTTEISYATLSDLMDNSEDERGGGCMKDYKTALLKLLGHLSDKSIKRIYQLAEYLYIYKEDNAK